MIWFPFIQKQILTCGNNTLWCVHIPRVSMCPASTINGCDDYSWQTLCRLVADGYVFAYNFFVFYRVFLLSP